MSNVIILIHVVWGTKNRYPYLTATVRKQVIDHIKKNCRSKSIYLKAINGFTDHLHCLVGMSTEMSLAKVVMLIKGESSFWINKNKIVPIKFEWAHEYYARTIGENDLARVIAYIDNQEEHHRNVSWNEEVEKMLKEYTPNDSSKLPG